MKFDELLNQYIEQLGCTAKEIAVVTGLSPASLSRYRTGERMPNAQHLHQITQGIVRLAKEKGMEHINRETVEAAFRAYLQEASFDYERFTANLNAMIAALDINISELSRALNFDSSYLSRIRLGQRRPSDHNGLIAGICQYVVRKKSKSAIAALIGCPAERIASESACVAALSQWLGSSEAEPRDYMGDFLKKLDEFDLDEYIRAIHFDELKVPSVPFQIPTTKTYYGIEAMKQGELDFFKSTVLSKSAESVFMGSDMPMEDMGEDLAFGKKWMFAIAMMLKKGLHLNVIHNIDRPFKEMMLGLESWIPIYMTGQVSPYYLKGKHNSVYCHFNYVSGQAALTGECIQGYHNEGQYYLTKNKEEVAYYRKKAQRLLEKASPLMEIYRSDSKNSYHAFLNAEAQAPGTRHNILSALPVYTAPEELLIQILKRNGVYETDGAGILAYAKKQRKLAEAFLQHSPIFDDISFLSQEEFERYPVSLPLAGCFYGKELYYTYDEYRAHLAAARRFAQSHPNYTMKADTAHAFRNIQIHIQEGKWVMVSKNKAPIVHFVMRHSKMLNAFENFIVPVMEEQPD